MTVKEAPKSKFVYPNKLYARCKDNKTLDISYAPQNMEAIEYTRTDTIIEDAIKWRTDIPQGDIIVANVKEDFCGKKDCYEVLHFASKPYPHYYDAWGEEVPYSAIEKWCLIK